MRRKFFALVSATLTVAFLLSGCASKPASTTASGKPTIEKIQKRDKVLVGVKSDVFGFGYKNPDTGKYEGFEIDLAKQIAREIVGDLEKVEFTAVTPKTRTGLLNNGDVDFIIATFSISDERKKELDFSQPYYEDGAKLLVKKNSGFSTLNDLNGKTIGVSKSATTGPRLQDEAKKRGIKINLAQFDTYPEILAALQAGRVDAMSTDGAILRYYESLDSSTVLLQEKYTVEQYGIATKKGNDDLRDLIASLLAKWDNSGDLKALKEKYGLQ